MSPEDMKAQTANFTLPKLPSPGKSVVYVTRPNSFNGLMVKFNVFVDGKEPHQEVGYTKGGQYIYFELTPGEHIIHSKAENWDSINIYAKEGEITYILQDVYMGFLLARNELKTLPDYEGKLHVKNLDLGTILK